MWRAASSLEPELLPFFHALIARQHAGIFELLAETFVHFHKRAREGEPLDVKILPLRLEADVADTMDEVWRAKGIKNRMEFFRGAIGHYLAHLGARDAAALLEGEGSAHK